MELASSKSWELCWEEMDTNKIEFFRKEEGCFSGGSVVKSLPANAGDAGLIPGPGRFHMPWNN